MFKEQWGLLCVAVGTQSQYPVWRYNPRERKSLHHSVNLMSSSPLSLKAGCSRFHCFLEAGCFLPTRQAALTTARSETHLNLAQRIWQRDTNQAVSKQPKDEYTSILPNLCTGALVFLWDVMRLPYDTVWYPPCFWAVYTTH